MPGPRSTPLASWPWWMAAPRQPRVLRTVCFGLMNQYNSVRLVGLYDTQNSKESCLSGARYGCANNNFLIGCMRRVNPAFLYPPDPEKAQRHRKANQIFKGLTPSDCDVCECCGRKIAAAAGGAACTTDPDQLSFLGPGVPLFFFYLRAVVVLLLAMSVVFSAFAIYSNMTTNDCTTLQVCAGSILNTMALINKRSSNFYFDLQGYIELAFILAALLFFQWMRLAARKLKKQCDEAIDSPSDYAVILRRLPPGTSEQDIQEMVEQRRRGLTPEEVRQTENLKVVKVVQSFSLREYLEVGNRNAENFKTAIKEQRHSSFVPEPQPTPTTPSSIAVVVFEHQSSKNLLIHRPSVFQRLLQALCTPCVPISDLTVRGQSIGIERAPEPDDICWENSGITMCGGIGRKLLYGSLAVVILVLGGAAQYGLQVLYNSTSDSTLQTLLTISNSLVVLVFNWVIMLTLVVTTRRERNQTLTEFHSVLLVKQTIFQFFNAGVFVIGAEVAARSDRFNLNDGTCIQISVVMLTNCFMPSLSLILLNYTEVINKLWVFLGEHGCMTYTQQELNELVVGPAVDLPSKYAYILKIVWLTGLYAPLVPIVVVVATVGLALNYLFEKILFTGSYSLPNTISSQGYENAMELLEYFVVAFGIGQIIAYLYFFSYNIDLVPIQTRVTLFASLALGVLNVILPMEAINEALFQLPESAKSEVKYSAIEDRFEVTYEMINPAYATTRERKNVKDILGLGAAVGEEGSRQVAYEMTNLFAMSLAGNAETTSKEPLLRDGGVERKQGKVNQPNTGEVKQAQEGILTSLLRNDKQSAAPSKGDQYDSIISPKHNPIKAESSVGRSFGGYANGSQEAQQNRQNPNSNAIPVQSSNPSVVTPTFNQPNANPDPRQELRSIRKQLVPQRNTTSTEPFSPAPAPASEVRNWQADKSSAPSATTANDSLLKRNITQEERPNKNSNTYTERKEEVEGEDGEKINISILEPPSEAKSLKKTPGKLLIDFDQAEPVPVPTQNSNSSTKYKKAPAFPPAAATKPKEEPQDAPSAAYSREEPSFLLQSRPEPRRATEKDEEPIKVTPQKNTYDQAPLATKHRPPPKDSPPSAPTTNCLYTPLVHNEEFKFEDPNKQKDSIYNPHLLQRTPNQPAADQPPPPPSRSYLNSEGIARALGRPFSSFMKKMEVEGMTERSGKREKR